MGLIRLQPSNLPSGSVLQVVQSYTADTGFVETTSTSFVASGLSVAITPTSINNFISIQMLNPMADHQAAGSISAMMYVNGSPMPGAELYHIGYQNSLSRYACFVFGAKYTPTSLSTLTFEPYYKSNDGNNTRFSHDNSSFSLIAMEIAG